jgi:hypothetical protein
MPNDFSDGGELQEGHRRMSFAPSGLVDFGFHPGLRPGLHSCAASRLGVLFFDELGEHALWVDGDEHSLAAGEHLAL